MVIHKGGASVLVLLHYVSIRASTSIFFLLSNSCLLDAPRPRLRNSTCVEVFLNFWNINNQHSFSWRHVETEIVTEFPENKKPLENGSKTLVMLSYMQHMDSFHFSLRIST